MMVIFSKSNGNALLFWDTTTLIYNIDITVWDSNSKWKVNLNWWAIIITVIIMYFKSKYERQWTLQIKTKIIR